MIHRYTSGWKGPDVIPDGPVEGINDVIQELRSVGFKVVVGSARCRYPEGFEAVKQKLVEWGIEVDRVYDCKPAAVVYIDDRAVRFNGNPRALLAEVLEFVERGPWMHRE